MPDPVPLGGGRLSDAHVAQYWEDGFLFPVEVMPAAEARGLRAELESIEAEWLDRDLPMPLNSYKRVNAQCLLPPACRIGADLRMLDVVEALLGPDILIYSVEFSIKEPRSRQMVSMHQDLTYWGLGAIDRPVTAWLSLSPAAPASGCMDFVRGSHRNPILPHSDTFAAENLLSRGQEIHVDIPEAQKIPIELHPGQISLHHGLTIHGSGPNRTGDRRIAAVVRYCRPDIAQRVADRDYAMLVRGADRYGNFVHYAPPVAPFSAASLALYDEMRQHQAQAMMAGADRTSALYA